MRLSLMVALSTITIGCQSLGSHVTSSSEQFDFCSLQGVQPNERDSGLWSAAMVQTGLTNLIADPRITGTAESAYALSYRRMTAARDKARCGSGPLVDKNPAMNLLTHELADIMSRWYIGETKLCLSGALQRDDGFCGVIKKSRAEHYDALSFAMASTAVYLSSHIAWSLSAVAFNDSFWDSFPDPATHHSRGPLDPALAARLKWLQDFKPTFDAFNGFLGASLDVVAKALEEGGLLKDHVLVAATYLSKMLPCKKIFFSSIRDKSYDSAIEIIKLAHPEYHPMIRLDRTRYVLDYTAFHVPETGSMVPSSVYESEAFALEALANPAARLTYKTVLGGKTNDELKCKRVD